MIKAVNRRQTDSSKWHKYADKDIIPLWIADTDFSIDEKIIQAVKNRLNHPVLGYPFHESAFIEAIVNHCQTMYDWTINPEWVVPIPGCVPGLNFSRGVSAMRGKQRAITATPVYPPFCKAAGMLDFEHTLVSSRWENQRWEIDFSALAVAAEKTDTGLLLLCHPHNPIGRVYSDVELAEYAKIAQDNNLIVCSDEIHCDLILNGTKHRPFASLNADTLKRTITLMSPSKTYNIAGMCAAYAIIADKQLRQDFCDAAYGFTDINVLGRVTATTAYAEGEIWRKAQIAYLAENAQMIESRLSKLTGISVPKIEATYLAFIDCRKLGLKNLVAYFEDYGLGLSDGKDFGAEGFVRLNFGCSHEVLNEALTRFEKAVLVLGKE